MTTAPSSLPCLLSPIERPKRASAQPASLRLPVLLPRLGPHALHRHGPQKLEVLDGQRAEKRLQRSRRPAQRRQQMDGLGELLRDERVGGEGLEERLAGRNGFGNHRNRVGSVFRGIFEERRGDRGGQVGQFPSEKRLFEGGELGGALTKLLLT